MNILKYSLIAMFAFGTLAVSGQSDAGAALFPDITPDVRGVGMGNSGVASTANAFSLYRNAAKTVFSDKKGEVGYSFTPWLRKLMDGSNLHGIGGYYNIDDKQGVTLGFRWFSLAEIDLSDLDGTAAGSFTPKNMSIDFGYARKVAEGLSIGATARFVRSDMSGMDDDAVANAVAFDLGLYYRRSLCNEGKSNWAVALQASNFGTKIDYGYGKYDQASKITVGGMIDYYFNDRHRLQGTLDVGSRVLPESCWEGAVGVEYAALETLFVRGGYHYGEESNRMQRYGTIGCGVNIYGVQADFAYLLPETDSFLKNTWQVSLAIDLGLFCKRKR